jgi:hypothetical protein
MQKREQQKGKLIDLRHPIFQKENKNKYDFIIKKHNLYKL